MILTFVGLFARYGITARFDCLFNNLFCLVNIARIPDREAKVYRTHLVVEAVILQHHGVYFTVRNDLAHRIYYADNDVAHRDIFHNPCPAVLKNYAVPEFKRLVDTYHKSGKDILYDILSRKRKDRAYHCGSAEQRAPKRSGSGEGGNCEYEYRNHDHRIHETLKKLKVYAAGLLFVHFPEKKPVHQREKPNQGYRRRQYDQSEHSSFPEFIINIYSHVSSGKVWDIYLKLLKKSMNSSTPFS